MVQWRQFHFKSFYHPFVCDFAKLLNDPLKGIPALMSRETQLQDSGFSFLRRTSRRSGSSIRLIRRSIREKWWTSLRTAPIHPTTGRCFLRPLLIATALSRNQRFEEAREWYHFMFNPLGVASPVPGGSAMSKYWITKPFFETTDPKYGSSGSRTSCACWRATRACGLFCRG